MSDRELTAEESGSPAQPTGADAGRTRRRLQGVAISFSEPERSPERRPQDFSGAILEASLNSLWMAYQPIVSVAQKRVIGHEALLRCRQSGWTSPLKLLDAAEKVGRLRDVGRIARSMSVVPMDKAPRNSLVFVNICAREIVDPQLYESDSPLAQCAPRVVLELTERSVLTCIPDLAERLEALRGLGFRLAVDDLGAGYSSLTSLAVVEPDFVKVDLSLIRGIHESTTKQKIVEATVRLCADLGRNVVAEGVETVEERDQLLELGCDLMQGFLFARPQPPFPAVVW